MDATADKVWDWWLSKEVPPRQHQGMQVPGPKQPSFAAAAQLPPAAAAAPAPAPKKRGHHAVPYEGDVSEWGKTQLEGFYDESDVEAEPSDLSSAISPRDNRPRLRSFNMEEATEVWCAGSSVQAAQCCF